MKLYYTGADKFNAVQKDPSKSLGGFISSTIIPNSYIGNIFSEADIKSIKQKEIEVKCIAVKNDSLATITAVKLEIVLDADSICNYKIGFSEAGTDDCGGKFFEQVINSQALPYDVVFQDITSEEILSLPDIEVDSYLGIWLIKSYKEQQDISTYPETKVPIKNCSYFEKIYSDSQVPGYIEPVIIKEEQIEFDFSWT